MLGRGFAQAAVRALDGVRSRVALRDATSVGDDVRVFGWPRVANEGELVVGGGVAFVSSPSPVELLVARSGSLVIGDGTLIESGAAIRARGRIRIGRGARIGAGCIIDDDGPEAGGIDVADGAWIEDGVVLLGGAQVPAGAVLERGVISSAPPSGPASSRPAPSSSRSSHDRAQTGSGGGDGEHRSSGVVPALDIDRRIRSVLARVVVGGTKVEYGTRFAQIKGWDSLSALRVLVSLEKEFGVVLPNNLFAQDPSIESVIPVILASVARRAETG